MNKDVVNLGEYLSKSLKNEGLFDVIEKSILPNKYGNSFFSLFSGLLYHETKKTIWKERMKKSLNAELINTQNRFKNRDLFRWEFKNYALLKLYGLIMKDPHEKGLVRKLRKRLLTMQHLESFQTNWIAMRAVNYLLRHNYFHNKKDLRIAQKELNKVLKRQNKDGFFWDYHNHHTFQYHAYILALLIQFYEIKPSNELNRAIEKGIAFLINITSPEGDCNYYGRGQKQLFGYTSAIFALAKWSSISKNKTCAEYARLIYKYIKPYVTKNSIVANDNQKERAGWYRYNYLTDYLSFGGVYLVLSQKVLPDLSKGDLPKIKEDEIFYHSLGIFIKQTKEYFICINSSSLDSTQLGNLIYIFPKTVACSGGPPINMVTNKKDYLENYTGIVENNYNPLFGKIGRLNKKNNQLEISYELKEYSLKQSFLLDKNLILKIIIQPKKLIKLKPLHYIALDKLKSSIPCFPKGKIITPEGYMHLFEAKEITINNHFEASLILFEGKQKPSTIITNIKSQTYLKGKNVFKLKEIIHFANTLLRKLLFHPKDFVLMLEYNKIRHLYKKKLPLR
jgi:hypothetical protein